MRIVGVGFSDVSTNAAWGQGLGYEYELWSDAETTLGQHYGALTEHDEAPLRHAFLLDEQGQALLFYEGGVSLGADPSAVLEDARHRFGD